MRKLFALLALLALGVYADVAVVPKPADSVPVIPLPVQPDKPLEDFKESPHMDYTPAITATEAEQAVQMILYHKPLTEPIWPNSKPQPFERLERLDDWGARGQYVTLNLAVYPLAELKNLKVRVKGTAVEPEIRLVRYWNVVYPNYNSYKNNPKVKLYRRMPEFLAPVTACDAPALEPQRFCLTFQLPKTGADKVGGDILVFHDGSDKAARIPFEITVLPFELKQDPNKAYTSYYYQVRNGANPFFAKNKNNKKLVHDVQIAEFKRMLEYGFTRPPVFQMTWGTLPDGTKDAYYIPYLDEFMAELKEAGFDNKHEIPVTGCSAGWLYEKFTGHKLSSFHMENIDCSKIKPELYEKIDSALGKFITYARKHNYPEIIFNPIDEPSAVAFDYVTEIYRIFKRHGLRTFQTSPPSLFLQKADELFDIYNYGAFNVPYEVAVSGKKQEYWCYPNDNTYQIKDPDVMCHGGRLTYGIGYWRSGFHCIIPWIWRSNTDKRLCNSGGNLLQEDGRLYMTTYWECFRQGVDDLRYIYTLEDAIVRRENSQDPKVAAAVKNGRAVLQKVWNTICPLPLYLREKLLPSVEIDGLRSEMAMALMALKAFPETQDKAPASVIIDTKGAYIERPDQMVSQNIRIQPVKGWKPIANELTLKEEGNAVDVKIAVDHLTEGEAYGGGVHYLCGWPRFRHDFDSKTCDLSTFSALSFDITVSSDRDAQTDYSWPISLGIHSKDGVNIEIRVSDVLEPNIKHHITIPISKLCMNGPHELRRTEYIQFFIGESNYAHGCHLNMKFENVRWEGYTEPALLRLDSPRTVALPVSNIESKLILGGQQEGETNEVELALLDNAGKILSISRSVAAANRGTAGFAGKGLRTGTYTIRARVFNRGGKVISEVTEPVTIIAGPAM